MVTSDLPGSQALSLPALSCSLAERVDLGQAITGGGGQREADMNVCVCVCACVCVLSPVVVVFGERGFV